VLSVSAQKVIDEVLAQLERYKDALRGVRATIIETELAHRRGEFVAKENREKQRVPAEERWGAFGDPGGMLARAERLRTQAERLKAQAERRIDALQGESVVQKTHEEQWYPAEERLDSVGSPYEVLTSPKRTLKELPSNERNEVRIRATPAAAEKFDLANFPEEDNLAFILTMSRVPARLLRMEAELVNVPRWFKWLLKAVECRIEFDYIRGVPVPKTSFMWIQSRGIGPWRLQMGNETEVRYQTRS
jgi:hypothetical protein